MAKSIIVYGVHGGKTRFAQRIADHFGLKIIRVGLTGSMYVNNTLGFVEDLTSSLKWWRIGFETRSFQSVADEINATISLTDWQSGPPPMVGEWNASPNKDTEERRWWDGYDWSCWYYKDESQESQNELAAGAGAFKVDCIQWRGLSYEPIKVTE